MKWLVLILVLVFSFVNINNADAASIGDACMWSTDCSTNFCQPKAFGGGAKICCDIQATYCDVDGYGGCSVYACSVFGAECGTFDDGCGGTKTCGDCSVYGGAKPYCQKGTCVSSCSGQFCGSGVVFQYTSSCGMGSIIQDCSTLGSDSYSSWTCNGNIKERTKTTTDGICNNHANGCVEATVGSNKESVDCSAAGQICSSGNCIAAPINGACGTANGKTYPSATTSWGSDTFCSAGTTNPTNPTFPSAGGTTTWSCVGSNGGTTASCSALRSSAAVNGVCGSSLNSCTAGTFQDTADDSTYYKWQCVGSSGGTTASCTLAIGATCDSSHCNLCTSSNCASSGCEWSTKNPTTGQDIGASNYHCCPNGQWWDSSSPFINKCTDYFTCSPQFSTSPLQGYNQYQQACCVYSPGKYTYQNIVPI